MSFAVGSASPPSAPPPAKSPTSQPPPSSQPPPTSSTTLPGKCAGYQMLASRRELPGFDIGSTNGLSSYDCQKLCDEEPLCDWVSHSGNWCGMKSWSTNPQHGSWTYLKLMTDCNYFAKNAAGVGSHMSTIDNVKSKEQCADMCRDSVDCDAANYSTDDLTCKLYQGKVTDQYVTYVMAEKGNV